MKEQATLLAIVIVGVLIALYISRKVLKTADDEYIDDESDVGVDEADQY